VASTRTSPHHSLMILRFVQGLGRIVMTSMSSLACESLPASVGLEPMPLALAGVIATSPSALRAGLMRVATVAAWA